MTGLAIAAPDGHGAYLDPAELTEADEQALAAVAGRRRPPEGAARRQGPDARVRGPRPAAGRAGLRHGAGRLPGAARPAHLRPGRPGAALPGQGAARGDRRRPADAGRLGRARRGGRPGAARPGHAGAGRGPGGRPGPARVGGAAARARAAAGLRAGQDGAHRDRRRRRALRGHVLDAARRGEGGRAGRVRGRRARVQPRLAQAAAGAAVHRARPAQDQAHQDRLHHRLRGADQPARADRPPGP